VTGLNFLRKTARKEERKTKSGGFWRSQNHSLAQTPFFVKKVERGQG
jgi:hypothetical protein